MRVARFAAEHGIDGLTFLRGIPGTIGGALRMNGGAYGGETKDVLVEAARGGPQGKHQVLEQRRHAIHLSPLWRAGRFDFYGSAFAGSPGDKAEIMAAMDKITSSREATQPIKSRTGGSTFKNPPGDKSWQLIDAAGMRGFAVGPAKVSEMHCNFLINEGGATAAQIEELGETVRARVKANSGVRSGMGDQAHWCAVGASNDDMRAIDSARNNSCSFDGRLVCRTKSFTGIW